MNDTKLAIEMSKLVHSECKDVPHDIGLNLLQIIKGSYVFTSEDIRNKLSPIKNLITMFEHGLIKVNIDTHNLILKEIEQCKKSIDYLSNK